MKYVALLSGGKDSCYTIVELHRQGHELICLANLHPPEGREEEDSYMYQTAGHDAIAVIAECFGKPLYRRAIAGTSANQVLRYTPTAGDEVEDLYQLLADVKAAHPEVEAVSSGAILSTYQRTRVEDVCSRLGLVSLAPLWQREQGQLLQDMLDSGIEAILVKVATLGLDPYKHINKSLTSLQHLFTTLHKKHGFHQCGEGGEYETLTLDCPMFATHRLVLDETEVVVEDDSGGTVGVMKVLKCHAEPKNILGESESRIEAVQLPDEAASFELLQCSLGTLRDKEPAKETTWLTAWHKVPEGNLNALEGAHIDENYNVTEMEKHTTLETELRMHVVLPHVYESPSGLLHISGVTTTAQRLDVSENSALDEAARQAGVCLDTIRTALSMYGASLADVAIVHVYVANMSHFSAINAAYGTAFGSGPPPPARCCVEARLPYPCAVMIDCIAHRGGGLRNTLQVRSLSPWAPVCVGPYSQTTTLINGGLILLSGQIGLLPTTMMRAPGGARAELAWCVRHASRLLAVLNSNVVEGAVCCILYVAAGGEKSLQEEWWRSAEEALTYELARNGGTPVVKKKVDRNELDSSDDESETDTAQPYIPPPILVVSVDALPRDCSCEVELLCMSSLALDASPRENFSNTSVRKVRRGTSEKSVFQRPDWLQLPPGYTPKSVEIGENEYKNVGSIICRGKNSEGAVCTCDDVSATVHTHASIMPCVSCQAVVTTYMHTHSTNFNSRLSTPSPVSYLSSREIELLMDLVLEGVSSALTCAHLQFRHLASLRIHHIPSIDGQLLKEASLLALRSISREDRPAIIIVPVAALAPDVIIGVVACALDLAKLGTELWIEQT